MNIKVDFLNDLDLNSFKSRNPKTEIYLRITKNRIRTVNHISTTAPELASVFGLF